MTGTLMAQANVRTILSGSGMLTVPSGVTTIDVYVWGGGGGGGNAGANPSAGGGGGGGACAISTIAVAGGVTTFNYSVGAGGTGNTTGSGNPGIASTFGTLLITAGGGAGGGGNVGSGAGGLGGTATGGSINNFAGGRGGDGVGTSDNGGGGGGSAGSGGIGGNGAVITAGTAGVGPTYPGSAGGVGGGNIPGSNGTAPGSGGGGAGKRGGGAANKGGNGADGRIIVVFRNVTGILPVGPSVMGFNAPYYSNLQNALDFIKLTTIVGATTLELQDANNNAPLLIDATPGASATNTITIQPKSGVAKFINVNTVGTSVLFRRAAKFYVIDGLNNLTISNNNTGTAAKTIEFTDASQFNTIRNCTILAAGSYVQTSVGTPAVLYYNGGTIFFGAASIGGQGNSNNTITGNKIGSISSVATAAIAIGSDGTNTNFTSRNTNITISNNEIYDFYRASSNMFGIFMGRGTSDWTISGNSFYQTASRDITTNNVDYTPIQLQNTASGENINITGNFFGGSAVGAMGGSMTITGFGAYKGIKINGSPGVKNIISSNTIRNIDFTTGTTDLCVLIYHSDGNCDIVSNNIGSQIAVGSIFFRSTLAGVVTGGNWTTPSLAAILAGGAVGEATVTGVVNITGNVVGGISAVRVGAAGDAQLRMIDCEGLLLTSFNVTGNTLGGTVANSISNATNNSAFGVVILGGAQGAYIHPVKNNIVRNISGTFAGEYATNRGIQVQSAASFDITGNIVSNIRSSGTLVLNRGTVGISSFATGNFINVSDNEVTNITLSSPAANVLSGIFVTGTAGGINRAARNKVYGLSSTTVSGVEVHGIYSEWTGNSEISNNMIVLGYDASGNDAQNNSAFMGIKELSSTGSSKIVYNSIHIGGTGTSAGSAISYGINSESTNSRIIANNLVVSDRVTTNSTNVGMRIVNSAGANNFNNNLYAVGSPSNFLASLNGTSYSTLATYQAASPTAIYTISVPVLFENVKTDLRCIPSPNEINFPVANEGEPVAGFTTDYFGTTRSNFTPDIGFHEFTCRGCWIGKNSTVWEVPLNTGAGGNWEDGYVPPVPAGSIISAKVYSAPNQPTINNVTGTATVNDLYLKSPAYLTLSNVTGGSLQVYRNFNNRGGLINGRFGVIEMKGAAAQIIPRALLENNALMDLINSNTDAASGVSLGGMLDIYRSFTYSAAGLRFNTNDSLTLKSTNLFTAFIGNFTGKTFTGKTTIERYLRSYKSWRFLATPIDTTTSPSIRNSWQEAGSLVSNGFGTQITGVGPGAVGMDQFTPFPSMKFFNPTVNNYVGITNTNDKIANRAGYYVFVRGDRAIDIYGGPTATNLRIKGDILRGNQTFTVPANKFASFGNPYPAQIDFRTVTKSNVTDQYMLWNPALVGNFQVGAYETYVRIGGTGGFLQVPGGTAKNFIESGQAVFLQNNSVSAGTITVRETDKSTGSNLVSREGAAISEHSFFLDMSYNDTNGEASLVDGIFMSFARNQSSQIDNSDVIKIMNATNNLSIISNSKKLIVERRPMVTESDTIYLNLDRTILGKYTFEVKPFNLDYNGLEARMYDKFTNAYTTLSTFNKTKFDFNITSDAASKALDRFKIVFTQAAQPSFAYINVDAARNTDKSIKVNWSVENEYPIANYEVERGNDALVFNKIDFANALDQASGKATYLSTDVTPFTKGTNYYRIKATAFDGEITYSSIVKVEEEKIEIVKPQITVFPNPVKGGVVNLSFAGQMAGKYTVAIYDNLGKLISTSSIVIASAQQTVKITAPATKAIYTMTISKPDGQKESIKFSVQ